METSHTNVKIMSCRHPGNDNVTGKKNSWISPVNQPFLAPLVAHLLL